MNRADQVFAMFSEANPVADDHQVAVLERPDPADFLRGLETPVRPAERRPLQSPTPQVPWRRLLPAVAAAAAIVAAVFLVALLSDREGTDEVAATRTPLETAELWLERFAAGDVDGFLSLVAPDAIFDPVLHDTPYFGGSTGTDRAHARDSRLLYASGVLDVSCSNAGPVVECVGEKLTAFNPADSAGDPVPYTVGIEFTVVDGVVTVFRPTGGPTGDDDAFRLWDQSRILAYGSWLEEQHPQDHADLFFLTSLLIDDIDQAERHRILITEWAATLR